MDNIKVHPNEIKYDFPKGSENSLKVIDLNQKQFTANNKEYFIESSLSFERFLMYQKLQIEVSYEPGFYGVFKALQKGYDSCNAGKIGDVAVILHNTMNGIKTIEDRRVPALELVCLFVNEKNEDRRVINDDIIAGKLRDWEAEGLDMMPFFQLAINSIQNFSSVYTELIQNISNKIKSNPISTSNESS